jgi:hypothetical protein
MVYDRVVIYKTLVALNKLHFFKINDVRVFFLSFFQSQPIEKDFI